MKLDTLLVILNTIDAKKYKDITVCIEQDCGRGHTELSHVGIGEDEIIFLSKE